MNLIFFGLIVIFITVASCDPTMYKKNDNNMFEPDLVPVSSTVIPENDMPNQEEITAEMDKEYKKAYFSLFKKKFDSKFEKPDTLMTDKKKFAKNSEKRAIKKPE
ncbi:unnamed protein product [Chironomus riparius]|uniref:Uncharacterized protein n=1 Tax=Chironomus riparius TaxID=315576 RepID=A0A9N9RPA9_9DIPT|nr:unnamed protein product [Chironomus riparius]